MNERHRGSNDAGDSSEAFRQRAGDLLRAAAQDLDARTASRLNRARQAALLQRPRRAFYWPASWRLPAVAMPAVATVAVAVLAVSLWPSQQPNQQPNQQLNQQPVPAAAAVDMDLLLTDDSLEMLEDLEFYAWLDADLSVAQLGAELESAS